MGYTHTWGWATAIDDAKKFARWSADVRRLHLAYKEEPPENPSQALAPTSLLVRETMGSWDTTLRGPEGTGSPVFRRELVTFNGNRTTENDSEAFQIHLNQLKSKRFLSCKTGGNPYDLLVTAALVRFEYYFPQIAIHCGGGVEGLEDAAELCQEVFGVGRNPLRDPIYCRYVDSFFGMQSA